MEDIKPDYYKDESGSDLFDEVEKKYTKNQVVTIYGFNIKKYVKRFQKKNGMEDLLKAREYASELQNYLNSDSYDYVDRLSDRLMDLTDDYNKVNGEVSNISDIVDEVVSDDYDDEDNEIHEERNQPITSTTELDADGINKIINEVREIYNDYCINELPYKSTPDGTVINWLALIKNDFNLKSIFDFMNGCFNQGYLDSDMEVSLSMNDNDFGSTELCYFLMKADEQ